MAIILRARKRDSRGNEIVGMAPTEGSIATFVSFDYTKKHTWWYAATDVTGETLGGGHTVFTFANDNIICKPMITDDQAITGRDLTIYVEAVEIDYGSISALNYITGVVTYTGGDITQIDFANGTVTFASTELGTVTADYSYSGTSAGNSYWEVVPTTGKILRINIVELQITPDFVIPSGKRAKFEILVNTTASGWLVANTNQYKSVRDFVARSNKGYSLPTTSEFTASEIIIMPWDYPAVIDLKYDLGAGYEVPSMKLRASITDDAVLTGEWAVIAAYCLSEDL